MRLSYDSDVIRERVAGPAFLIENETIQYVGRVGLPASVVVIAAFAALVPPWFIWGALLLYLAHRARRTNGLWITNRRLVYFEKDPFSKSYMVQSVPLHQIRTLRFTSLAASGGFLRLVDRLLGVADLQVLVHDSSWVQVTMVDIKNPKAVIAALKASVPDKVEA